MTTSTIDNKVKSVISNIRNLPTPPMVFHQIQNAIKDPKVNAARVAKILAEDPAMSVKILKLTNSAFYGLSREIESVKEAVAIIGFEAIKNLVLSASILDMFKGENMDVDFHEKYWRHSLATALCCRLLTRKIKSRGSVDPDSAFSAGLLHDIGKIVISCYLKNEYVQFKKERENDKQSSDYVIEERILGFNHAQIGGILGEKWKIPQKLTEAITFHHHPQLYESDDPVAYIVYLADYISKKTFYLPEEEKFIAELDKNVMEYLQIDENDIEKYSELLKEEYVKSETFMQMVGIS